LQEVAAAQHVLVVCGSAEIDGYAFCFGLTSLRSIYEAQSHLASLIRSATYLIRRVVFRPETQVGQPGGFALRVRPLGELVDMYHTREASDLRDKVYALIGMSSDREKYPQLFPDYTVSWQDLLRELVRSLLGVHMTVRTWDDEEISVIEGRGYVAGEVSAVADDGMMHDRQRVYVWLRPGSSSRVRHARWILQPFAKPVRRGDLICVLHGATAATILRPYSDYCAIIATSVIQWATTTISPRSTMLASQISLQDRCPTFRMIFCSSGTGKCLGQTLKLSLENTRH
jgi:hypothetical protein